MTNLQMWSLIIGFFLPLVIGALKRNAWSSGVKAVFAFLVSVVVGAATIFFQQPDWDWSNFVATTLLILVTAIATYNGIWKPTTIEPQIAKATG